ncbi:MAG: glycosyltransferase [Aquihabitans sp.]
MVLVSVVIPAVQADRFLRSTLASIRSQDLPPETDVEIVVALKEPTDAELGGAMTVANPSGSIPAGLNAALAASTGSIVLRCDSRCDLPPDYITRCLDHLSNPTIGMVGGAPLVIDDGLVGGAYGIAFNSPLLGPSRHRYSRVSGPIESPYLGAWRREVLVELGAWDERLLRNQDNELADRVQAAGLTVWYDHTLVVGYVAGRPLEGILRHHHGFGRWRMAQRSLEQTALTPRHRAAVGGLVAGGAGAALTARRLPPRALLALGAATYGAAVAVGSVTSARLQSARPDLHIHPQPVSRLLAPALAAAINGAWALGLIRGLIERTDSPSG